MALRAGCTLLLYRALHDAFPDVLRRAFDLLRRIAPALLLTYVRFYITTVAA